MNSIIYLGNNKRCSKCGKYKDMATEYHKNKDSVRGVASRCKECENTKKYRNREDMFWNRFWAKVMRVGECLEWTGAYNGNGVPQGTWKGRVCSLRRVIYKLTAGDLPDDMYVITTCQNQRCVSQRHMKKVSRDEFRAYADSIKATGANTGRRKHPEKYSHLKPPIRRGEQVKGSKLTAEAVRSIRKEYAAGMHNKTAIAKRYGVDPSAIHQIIIGKTWKHVQ